MKSEGHIGKAIRDRVVELDPLTQPLSETPTPRLIKAPRFGIEQEYRNVGRRFECKWLLSEPAQ